MMFLYTIIYYFWIFWVFVIMLITDGVGQMMVSENDVMASLSEYDDCEIYHSDGIQDNTDYAEYYYSYLFIEDIIDNRFLRKVEQENVSEIRAYIDDFEQRIDNDSELQENYNFDISEVEVGDYFYIEADDDFYGSYEVYYFDMETETLYYLHSEI